MASARLGLAVDENDPFAGIVQNVVETIVGAGTVSCLGAPIVGQAAGPFGWNQSSDHAKVVASAGEIQQDGRNEPGVEADVILGLPAWLEAGTGQL